MKIVIIEDEPLVARDIQHMVKSIDESADIVALLTSVKGAIKWFRNNDAPDLILSDIQLSDGDSFEIFEAVTIPSSIIFTTAYDDFAIRAFKLNSIDYLLKPIDRNELERAIAKYKSRTGQSLLNEEIRRLFADRDKAGVKYKDRFLVLHGGAMVPLVQDEIAFFHKEQLIFVHNTKNEKFICEYQALDDVEELVNPSLFFRVNRQYLIHIHAVEKVKSTHKGLVVILKNPLRLELDVSREKATAFKNWLG